MKENQYLSDTEAGMMLENLEAGRQPFASVLGHDRTQENAAGKILTHPTRWYVDPLTCGPESINIADIAHALSMTCRYAGHVPRFYSVAQHSIIVSAKLPQEKKLAGLLHDSEEAYLLDLPSPIKKSPIFEGYRVACARLRKVIFARFGVDYALYDEEVKAADNAAYRLERESFWGSKTGAIEPFEPEYAERRFLHVFRTLKGIL